MKLYRMSAGAFIEDGGRFFAIESRNWDELIAAPGLLDRARRAVAGGSSTGEAANVQPGEALAPVVGQEVWAAGVTYYRSRNARIEESKGGGSFYDRVYEAKRPELFFKANGHQVIGPGGPVRIRRDASWSVPEPEWTLVLNRAGEIVGYTIGNDMSSRDIEGENPLYLPQAKVYDGSCAIGPCVLLAEGPFSRATTISIEIERAGDVAFAGETTLAELKREPELLAEYLFRENSFPNGALLMTGTGIVPGDEFTLAHGDVIRIEIAGIGVLTNTVG